MKKRNTSKTAGYFLAFIFIMVILAAFFTPLIDNSAFAQESNYLKKIFMPFSKMKMRKSQPLAVTTDTLTMTGHTTQVMKANAEPIPSMGRPPSTQTIITDPMMMTGRP